MDSYDVLLLPEHRFFAQITVCGKDAGTSRGRPGIVLGKIHFSDLGKFYEIFCGIKSATLDFAL